MNPQVIMYLHKGVQAAWHHFHEAVLTGQQPFNLAHGKSFWELTEDNPEFNMVFKDSMASYTSSVDKPFVSNYKDHESVKTLVDVGGGTGLTLRTIVSKYPHIQGITFDLPHVVAQAPPSKGILDICSDKISGIRTRSAMRWLDVGRLGIPGLMHVGGNMFESVPKRDAIILKRILHDWNDESCVVILKNCLKSIPEHGKVIISEYMVPNQDNNPFNQMGIVDMDLAMLALTDGGVERTKGQWQALLKNAGFARCEFLEHSSSSVTQYGFIEAYKH